MELLGRREEKVTLERRKEEVGEEIETEQITREEVIRKLRQLKGAKASGENGVTKEVWRFMPKEIGEAYLKLLQKIWKGKGMPNEWRMR